MPRAHLEEGVPFQILTRHPTDSWWSWLSLKYYSCVRHISPLSLYTAWGQGLSDLFLYSPWDLALDKGSFTLLEWRQGIKGGLSQDVEPREDGLRNREKGEVLGKERGSKRVCDLAFLLVLQGHICFLWHFWLLFSTSVQWLLNTWTRTPHRLRCWTFWSSVSRVWVLLIARLRQLARGWWGGGWEVGGIWVMSQGSVQIWSYKREATEICGR